MVVLGKFIISAVVKVQCHGYQGEVRVMSNGSIDIDDTNGSKRSQKIILQGS